MNLRALFATTLLLSSSLAQANITETLDFTASNFIDAYGNNAPAPYDIVSGSFTFTFDSTQNYSNWTSGVTINSFSLLGLSSYNGSQAYFSSVYETDDPQFGQVAVAIENPSGAELFQLSLYHVPFFNGVVPLAGIESYSNAEYVIRDSNGNVSGAWTGQITTVPAPSAIWLFGSALAGFGIFGRRKAA